MSTLTCLNQDCDNYGMPVELDLTVTDPWTGQRVYVDAAVCGICGQPITDIDPPLSPGAPVT